MSGKITKRGPDGRILPGGRELSSEEARAMQAKKHALSVDAKKSDYETLLAEAGYDNPDDAPKVLQVVAKDIANQGNRTMQAVVQYRQLTDLKKAGSLDKPETGKPAPGTICPKCNELVMTDFRPDASQRDAASEYLDRHRKSYLRQDEDDREPPPEKGTPFDD